MKAIENIIQLPESKVLEFKRDISSFKPILKTIVAFANTAGGTIVIGVDDDKTVIGLKDVLQAEESLASSISDGIMPGMMPEIEIVSFQGVHLLLIKVARWRGPFYLKSQGPEQGVYIRFGSTNRKAGDEILEELQRSSAGIYFDQMPCIGTNETDCHIEDIKSVFNTVGKTIDKQKLETLGLIVQYAGKKILSNGCLILFGKGEVRNHFFPDARVSCARFRGTDKSEFIDRLDIEGNYFDVIDTVPKFIKRNTRLYSKIESFHREDIPSYPEIAVREVLINSLAHTDYSIKGMRIFISIFSDRMEIQNPGMLPFGMTLDDFKAGVSKVRNRVICRVFRELGLMEEWGSGYSRIIKSCRDGGYPEPEWMEQGVSMKVAFRPHPETHEEDVPVNAPVNVPVNSRQQWFLDQVKVGVKVSANDIAGHWKVSEKTAKRDIADLKRKRLIKFRGAPKNGTYFLKKREITCLPKK